METHAICPQEIPLPENKAGLISQEEGAQYLSEKSLTTTQVLALEGAIPSECMCEHFEKKKTSRRWRHHATVL